MEYIGKLEEGNESGTINVMKLRGRIVFSDGSKFIWLAHILPVGSTSNDLIKLENPSTLWLNFQRLVTISRVKTLSGR